MPYYAIVIADAKVAHAKELERNLARNVHHHVTLAGHRGAFARVLTTRLEAEVRRNIGAPKQDGDLHDIADSACPDGQPNCRNCGDPTFETSCRAAGHCDHCGRASVPLADQLGSPDANGGHGLAPDAVLAARGYALLPIDPPPDGHVWSRVHRRFVKP